jgi:VWFA-related protein
MRAVVAAVCAASATLGTVSARQATFRSGVDVVSVDVSVRLGSNPVPGLAAADFEVTDNGVRQKLESASVETLPIDVTLLLDVSRSVDGPLLGRLKQAVRETAALLRPADRLRLIAIHERITQVFPWQPGGSAPSTEALTAEGATALYDGLVAALVRPNERERRQLVVALTDGQDTLSITPLDTTRDVALRSDAVLHIVEPIDPKAKTPFRSNDATLRDLAHGTGGQLFLIQLTDSIGEAFKTALDDFRTSYVLRYMPQGVKREGWHDIVVTVTKPGAFEIRARKGYSGG